MLKTRGEGEGGCLPYVSVFVLATGGGGEREGRRCHTFSRMCEHVCIEDFRDALDYVVMVCTFTKGFRRKCNRRALREGALKALVAGGVRSGLRVCCVMWLFYRGFVSIPPSLARSLASPLIVGAREVDVLCESMLLR